MANPSRTKVRPPHAALIEPLESRLLMARALGIDVSTYQGTVNWTSVKNSGRSFAIMKATEGVTFLDSTWATNIVNSKNAGLYVAGYHYARYDNNVNAVDEANWYLSKASNYIKAGYLRPVLDVENPVQAGDTIDTKAEISAWVNTWCNTVKNATGVSPIVYTYISYASSYLDSTVTQWPLWMANYNGQDPQTGSPNATAPWSSWAFWQNSDSGSVPGVSGPVDTNVFNGTEAQLLANYVIPQPFAVGTTVIVAGTGGSGLRAWSDSSSIAPATFVTKPEGSIGTIVGGPVFAQGFNRWQIRYAEDTVDRWSAEDFLDPVTATPAVPANLTPASPSTQLASAVNFNWDTAANAGLYDFYFDGTLRGSTYVSQYSLTGLSDGAHTWRVVSRNSAATATTATFNLTVDTVAPAASFGQQTPTLNATTYDFTITYTDAGTGLDATTFDSSDITVTGPNAFSQTASFVSVNTPGNGSPRTVTYRINAPGGKWNAPDSGTYTFTQNATQIRDVAGQFRPAGIVGTAAFTFAFAYRSGLNVIADFTGINSPLSIGTTAGGLLFTHAGTSITIGGTTTLITVNGTSGNDTLDYNGPFTPPVAFAGGTGNDTLNINSGTPTFTSNLGTASANLSLNVAAGAIAGFSAPQTLAALSVAGQVNVNPLGSRTLLTRSLSLTGTGVLSLADNDLLIDYPATAASPFPQLNDWVVNGINAASAPRILTLASPVSGPYIDKSTALALFDNTVAELTAWGTQSIDPSTVVGKFTFFGDVNIDGQTDDTDYSVIDAFVGQTGTSWLFGDANFDGQTTDDDYSVIDAFIGSGLGAPLARPAAGTAYPGTLPAPTAGLFADDPARLSVWAALQIAP